MKIQTQNNNNYQGNNNQNKTSIGKKIGDVACDVGNAFLDGAVSVAKDVAKDQGKKLAGKACDLAGSIFSK